MRTATPTPADADWLRVPLRSALRGRGRRMLPELLLATGLVTLLALAMPLVLLQVYDRVLPNGATGTLTLMTAAVTTAILLETGLRMLRGAVLGRMAAVAEAEAHRAAIARIAGAPTAAFEAHGNGWYAERLTAIGSLREAWSGPALQALLDLPFAALYLVAVWFLAGDLVLVPLGALAGVLLLCALNGRLVRRRAEALAAAEERRFNFLFDVLRGLGSLKAIGAERLLERRYERLGGTSAALRRALTGATAGGTEGGLLLAHLTTVGTAAWGCLMVLDGHLTVGGLGACTMLAGRTMQPLLGAVALWARTRTLRDARWRVAELAALPAEGRPAALPLRVTEGAVVLRDVRFGRRADGTPLFEGLSLDVAPGGFVGITGPNGSGRSSLLRLIIGEVTPDAGTVCVDGRNLAVFDATGARRDLALVPPDPAIIGGTLLENLTLHQPALADRAMEFATTLGLDGVAAGLPNGWHTPVGTGALPLPRGVAQRIGVVRALVQSPRVLLLDDVTAQLDADGDARLARVLSGLRGRVTVILVSHRRSTLALADRVLDIRDGRLEERP